MAQGSKKKYTSKQKRKAEHIEDGVRARGGSTRTAERIAWATVNKQDGGGKQGGGGTRKKTSRKAGKRTSAQRKKVASAAQQKRRSKRKASKR